MIAKNKGGRPTIELTPKQVKKVEEISSYLTCEQIADYFGISHTAFQDIRARQPEVLLAYKKGRVKKILKYTKLLENKADGTNQNADATSIIFYLKTQAGWSIDTTKKIQVSVPDNLNTLEIIDRVIVAACKNNLTLSEVKQITDLAQVKQQLLANSALEQQEQKRYSIKECLEISEKLLAAAAVMEKKVGGESNEQN